VTRAERFDFALVLAALVVPIAIPLIAWSLS